MTAKDAPRAETASAQATSAEARDASAAAARLRAALELVGFEVDRDFITWEALAGPEREGVSVGGLSVATANRLWLLLEQCASAGLSVRPDSSGQRGPRTQRRREQHAPAEARRAAAHLRAELKRAGFDLAGDFEECTADCTASGMGLVLVGLVPTATANQLSVLIEGIAALTSHQCTDTNLTAAADPGAGESR